MTEKKRILILGGLGFIGRNLFNTLHSQGHDITILTDYLHDDHAINEVTLKTVVVGSILDKEYIEKAVAGYDVIYSLAGSSGASDSVKNPYHDLDNNLKGHLNILEGCRKTNPHALLVFPSSRLVYGKPQSGLVDEKHPIQPESIYAIHKLTTEHYYLLYQRLYGIRSIILRISNPYGPYQRFGSNNYGILNWFIHKAVVGEPITIYGDGLQKRDFIFIDDVVSLLNKCIFSKEMIGKVYNVGLGRGIPLKDAVGVIKDFLPETKVNFQEWPALDKMIETGDYISDIRLLEKDTGWKPSVLFEEGVKKTIEFYVAESGK
ncbi:MAG TPA: NAD-dependent epimerase/dehydratase family protein [Chryseosolibacter sp.]|nr:NAD-dependent epimerase/dehydratase family protein [Chryseosolibacter sp.]